MIYTCPHCAGGLEIEPSNPQVICPFCQQVVDLETNVESVPEPLNPPHTSQRKKKNRARPSFNPYILMSVAAIVLVAIGVGLYLWIEQRQEQQRQNLRDMRSIKRKWITTREMLSRNEVHFITSQHELKHLKGDLQATDDPKRKRRIQQDVEKQTKRVESNQDYVKLIADELEAIEQQSQQRWGKHPLDLPVDSD